MAMPRLPRWSDEALLAFGQVVADLVGTAPAPAGVSRRSGHH